MSRHGEVILWEEERGEEVISHELPSKFEVCPRCKGHGSHLHPAIGSHAYSREEFDEAFPEEEEREAYMTRGGMYDVPCEQCHGENVVAVVDAARCDPEILERYAAVQERERAADREWKREQQMEARMLGERE